MKLWEVEIRPSKDQVDREAERVLHEASALPAASIAEIASARSFLIQSERSLREIETAATKLLLDPVVETMTVHEVSPSAHKESGPHAVNGSRLINVLFKSGVTDNVAQSTKVALSELGLPVDAVATCRKYWVNKGAERTDLEKLARRVLANDAIEQVIWGPIALDSISLGNAYQFRLRDRTDPRDGRWPTWRSQPQGAVVPQPG